MVCFVILLVVDVTEIDFHYLNSAISVSVFNLQMMVVLSTPA